MVGRLVYLLDTNIILELLLIKTTPTKSLRSSTRWRLTASISLNFPFIRSGLFSSG